MQAHCRQRLHHPVTRVAAGLREVEPADRNRQQVVHSIEGIEHRKRVLEDRLHLAAEGHALIAREIPDVTALVQDLSRRGREKSEQKHREGGLAAPAFPCHGEDRRLILFQSERDAAQGDGRGP